MPVDNLYDDHGAFLNMQDLRQKYSQLNRTGDHKIITYCTIGARASTTWFVLTYLLGHKNVVVYDGSWAEWGRSTDTPIELSL